tara:strand:- start:1557 stop:1886 length:330 start_codon:yes stop_codon:yes gene_type:complete
LEEDFTNVVSEEDEVRSIQEKQSNALKQQMSANLYLMHKAGVDISDYVDGLAKEASRRMSICKECPSLMRFNRCSECGCFMNIKTKLPMVECPLDKWGKYNRKTKMLKK